VSAQFSDYTVPGIYRVTAPAGADFLAVNATRAESNFEKLQLADLQTKLSPLALSFEQEDTLGQEASGNLHPFRELSAIFMVALIAILVAENVCANRF